MVKVVERGVWSTPLHHNFRRGAVYVQWTREVSVVLCCSCDSLASQREGCDLPTQMWLKTKTGDDYWRQDSSPLSILPILSALLHFSLVLKFVPPFLSIPMPLYSLYPFIFVFVGRQRLASTNLLISEEAAHSNSRFILPRGEPSAWGQNEGRYSNPWWNATAECQH